MKKKKKSQVLILSGTQVFPALSGGELRTTALASSLHKAGYEVTVYALTGRKKDYLARKPSGANEVAPGLVEYVDRRLLFAVLQFICYRLWMPDFWLSLPLWRLWLPRRLKNLMQDADHIILDFPYAYPMIGTHGHKSLLNSHNLEHQRWSARWHHRLCYRPLVRWVEDRAAKVCAKVIACAPEDESYFHALLQGDRNIVSVPNGLGQRDLQFSADARRSLRRQWQLQDDEKVLLFIGSLYGPNLEAYTFLQRFEEQYREQLENAKIVLLVVGAVGGKARREGQIQTTGLVPNIEGYFSAADFGLNLVEQGSGTNIKMFEFMAAQLPIITTPFGCRGLEITEEQAIIVPRAKLQEKLMALDEDMGVYRKRAQSCFESHRSKIYMHEAVKAHLLPVLALKGSKRA